MATTKQTKKSRQKRKRRIAYTLLVVFVVFGLLYYLVTRPSGDISIVEFTTAAYPPFSIFCQWNTWPLSVRVRSKSISRICIHKTIPARFSARVSVFVDYSAAASALG